MDSLEKNGIKNYNKLFLYTANKGSSKISGHSINTLTGELTAITGSPWNTGTQPYSVTVDPLGKFVYTANEGSNNISGYSINQSTGELTPITGSPWNGWIQPRSIAIESTGRFLYAANRGSNNISGYNINQYTGELTEILGSPWSSGEFHWTVSIDSNGKFIYVCNNNDSAKISSYSINPSTGVLTNTPYSPFTTSCIPSSSLVDITGKYLYVTAYNCAQVRGYNINAETGDITAMTDWIFTSGPVNSGPASLAEDPTGKFVFALNCVLSTIAGFTVNKNTGTLAPIPPTPDTPMPAGSGPSSIIVDPTGKFVYVANYNDNNISGYVINQSTGELTAITGSPWAMGTNPVSIVIAGVE